MASNPNRSRYEVSDEEITVLDERLKTLEDDEKIARDAAEVLADIRHNIKHPVPR